MIMMIIYLHNKNSGRQHLVPNLVQAGLVMSLVGDVLLMSKEISSFIIGTGFFLIAHIFYIVAFSIGDEIRYIQPHYKWLRKGLYFIAFALCMGNLFMTIDLMPNKIIFPLYGVVLALMVSSALKRY
jgi:uncharacterized membrane protein YhhN